MNNCLNLNGLDVGTGFKDFFKTSTSSIPISPGTLYIKSAFLYLEVPNNGGNNTACEFAISIS